MPLPPFPQAPSQISPEMQTFLDQLMAWRAGNNFRGPETTGHQGPGGSWVGTINWGDRARNMLSPALVGGARMPPRVPRSGTEEASGWHVRYREWAAGRGPHPGPHPLTGQMYLDPRDAPKATPTPTPDPTPTPITSPGGINDQSPINGPFFPPGPPLPGEIYPTPPAPPGSNHPGYGPQVDPEYGAPAPVQRTFPTTSVPVGNMPPIGTGVGGGGPVEADLRIPSGPAPGPNTPLAPPPAGFVPPVKSGAVPYLNYLLGR